MSNKNCINCGAPFNIELNKCPYCGTSYFDMSCLDLDSGKPFVLKIKTKINGKNCFITQMVRPLNNLSIEVSQYYDEIYGGFDGVKRSYGKYSCGKYSCKYNCGQSVKTNLSLESITLPNQKETLRIEVED